MYKSNEITKREAAMKAAKAKVSEESVLSQQLVNEIVRAEKKISFSYPHIPNDADEKEKNEIRLDAQEESGLLVEFIPDGDVRKRNGFIESLSIDENDGESVIVSGFIPPMYDGGDLIDFTCSIYNIVDIDDVLQFMLQHNV